MTSSDNANTKPLKQSDSINRGPPTSEDNNEIPIKTSDNVDRRQQTKSIAIRNLQTSSENFDTRSRNKPSDQTARKLLKDTSDNNNRRPTSHSRNLISDNYGKQTNQDSVRRVSRARRQLKLNNSSSLQSNDGKSCNVSHNDGLNSERNSLSHSSMQRHCLFSYEEAGSHSMNNLNCDYGFQSGTCNDSQIRTCLTSNVIYDNETNRSLLQPVNSCFTQNKATRNYSTNNFNCDYGFDFGATSSTDFAHMPNYSQAGTCMTRNMTYDNETYRSLLQPVTTLPSTDISTNGDYNSQSEVNATYGYGSLDHCLSSIISEVSCVMYNYDSAMVVYQKVGSVVASDGLVTPNPMLIQQFS